jgi:signal transduction histidine kinase
VNRFRLQLNPGHIQVMWPVVLILLSVLLIPSACILWFMKKAVENERLAGSQKLAEAYQGQLKLVRLATREWWDGARAGLERSGAAAAPRELFAQAIQRGDVDSLLILDAAGKVLYPDEPALDAAAVERSTDWSRAERLESARDFNGADQAYERIQKNATEAGETARALQGRARCALASGDRERALKLVLEFVGATNLDSVMDSRGRVIAPGMELMGLELLGKKREASFELLSRRLEARLNDYKNSPMTASQRRFLMRELKAIRPDANLPTFPAEELAARYLESERGVIRKTTLAATSLENVWHAATGNGRLIALIRTETLGAKLRTIVESRHGSDGIRMVVSPPGMENPKALASIDIDPPVAGWKLEAVAERPEMMDIAARDRIAVHLWTGGLVIAVMLGAAVFATGLVRRQLNLARLKNDLAATVSHELKTPLSSIRLLVDTLLENPELGQRTVREYLELISRENIRLSRLIESFLLFSKLERRKHVFNFKRIDPGELAGEAANSVRERFETGECKLSVDIPLALPAVRGDRDALITCLINLLDNAFKYSEAPRKIDLHVEAREGRIFLSVSDNGIGIAPREMKRIFRRFYQVDQGLAREAGGCGLGLSIVKYILKAHEGEITVESTRGQGSRFTIVLPVADFSAKEGR